MKGDEEAKTARATLRYWLAPAVESAGRTLDLCVLLQGKEFPTDPAFICAESAVRAASTALAALREAQRILDVERVPAGHRRSIRKPEPKE